jgi:hypothetical protein
MRRHRSLRSEIAIVLAVKMLALGVLYAAFFGPSHRLPATADRTAQMFFGSAHGMRHK